MREAPYKGAAEKLFLHGTEMCHGLSSSLPVTCWPFGSRPEATGRKRPRGRPARRPTGASGGGPLPLRTAVQNPPACGLRTERERERDKEIARE